MIIDNSTPMDGKDASTSLPAPLDVNDPKRPKISIRPRCKEYAMRRREAAEASSSLTSTPSTPAISSASFIPNVLLQMKRKQSSASRSELERRRECRRQGASGSDSPKDNLKELRKPRLRLVKSGAIEKPPRIHPTRAPAPSSTPPSYVCPQCVNHASPPPECNICKLITLMDKFCDTVTRFERTHAARMQDKA